MIEQRTRFEWPVLVQALGGLLLVSSTFMRWVDQGLGSALTLGELGDLLLDGRAATVVSRWVGVVVYLVPLSGALVVIGAGIDRPVGRRLALVGLVVAVVLVVAAFALVWSKHLPLGPGAILAALGALLAGLGMWWQRRSSSVSSPSGT